MFTDLHPERLVHVCAKTWWQAGFKPLFCAPSRMWWWTHPPDLCWF